MIRGMVSWYSSAENNLRNSPGTRLRSRDLDGLGFIIRDDIPRVLQRHHNVTNHFEHAVLGWVLVQNLLKRYRSVLAEHLLDPVAKLGDSDPRQSQELTQILR